jgi:hypothetical protein
MRALLLPLLLLVAYSISAIAASNYLYGGPDPICWRTEIARGIASGELKLDTCPPGMALSLDYITVHPQKGVEAALVSGAEIHELDVLGFQFTVLVTLDQIPPFFEESRIQEVKHEDIGHCNVHSCVKNVGICAPFIENNPELSTHSSEMVANFTGEAGVLHQNFSSHLILPAETYT